MKVILTDRAVTDLERLQAFMAGKNPQAAARISDEILDALESLAEMPLRWPLLDPERDQEIRKQLIEAGSGYIAAFDLPKNEKGQVTLVRVLAVRSAREAGF